MPVEPAAAGAVPDVAGLPCAALVLPDCGEPAITGVGGVLAGTLVPLDVGGVPLYAVVPGLEDLPG
ncbi:MAG: hypothetical protein ACREQF_03660 [Candidatus Binataceae bacterium]